MLFAFQLAIAPTSAEDRSADAAQRQLSVRNGDRVRWVAAEPLVVDPVSGFLDREGRLWVVEMPDYPTGPRDGGKPSGKIKILRDSNSDGRFDAATVFADQLSFATGVLPYRDGAFVTLARRILFLRDTDGDGIADESRTLFEGFAEQNEQLRANHPVLGPDGRVYVANGLRGGQIRAVDPRYDNRPRPLDLRDRDFCFDPEGGHWGGVAGNSQFGLTIDDFGRRIGCSNRNPAMMATLGLETIERNPLLVPRDAIADVALAAEASVVKPISEAWTTSNLHSGQFSAACGVYAPGLVRDASEWLLVCEPTASLVQRQRMRRHATLWQSRREEQPAEFLASADTWFRPVDITAGPGSSVYVIDMARAVIEHPHWMPPELKLRPDQWDGNHLGRIWQVGPEHALDSAIETLTTEADAQRWLRSDSPWKRQRSSQFFLEHAELIGSELVALVQSGSEPSTARARAAYLLDRQNMLDDDLIRTLLSDQDPRLRWLAILLSSGRISIESRIIDAAPDSDPLVARLAADLIGSGHDDPQARSAALARIASTASDVPVRQTLASVDPALLPHVAAQLVRGGIRDPELVSRLIERMAIESAEAAALIVHDFVERSTPTAERDVVLVALLDAWVAGAKRGKKSPQGVLARLPPEAKATLVAATDRFSRMAADDSVPPSIRAQCIELCAEWGSPPTTLRELALAPSPAEVRIAALSVMLKSDAPWARAHLAENLMGMTHAARTSAIAQCARDRENSRWLLEQLERARFPKSVIDPATAKAWQQHADETIRRKASELFRTDPDRLKVLNRYASAAEDLGDPLRGKPLFQQHCSACHRIGEVGTNVGPDISDSRAKSPAALLASILDPNAAIDAAYVQYKALTLDGHVVDGLLIGETGDAAVLLRQGGHRVELPHEEIEMLQTTGISLMPEGFEQSITATDMSHLLAYLKQWRYLDANIPGTLSPAE